MSQRQSVMLASRSAPNSSRLTFTRSCADGGLATFAEAAPTYLKAYGRYRLGQDDAHEGNREGRVHDELRGARLRKDTVKKRYLVTLWNTTAYAVPRQRGPVQSALLGRPLTYQHAVAELDGCSQRSPAAGTAGVQHSVPCGADLTTDATARYPRNCL